MTTSRSALSDTLTARETFAVSRAPSSATDSTLTSCVATSLLVVHARQVAHGVLGAGRAHERLAYQHGIDSDAFELLDLGARADAGLGDDRLAGRHGREQVDGRLDVDREVLEIAIVDPDHVCVQCERLLELLLIMHLH